MNRSIVVTAMLSLLLTHVGNAGAASPAAGDLLIADAVGGQVLALHPSPAGVLTQIARWSGGPMRSPTGLGWHANRILVTDPLAVGGPAVIEIDPADSGSAGEGQKILAWGGDAVAPVAVGVAIVGSHKGAVVVVDRESGGSGGLLIVSGTTLSPLTGGSPFGEPTGLAVTRTGAVLVADPQASGGLGGLLVVPDAGSATMSLVTGLVSPSALAVAADDVLYVADPHFGNGAGGIAQVQNGVAQDYGTGHPYVSPRSLAVTDTGVLFVADVDAQDGFGAIFRVAIGGAPTALDTSTTDLVEPTALMLVPACGNGLREQDEQCDDANDVNADCCSQSCSFEPGTVCRTSAGVCDIVETCPAESTACPPDTLASSSIVCRSAGGVCDMAEHCTGTAPSCPGDVKVSSGTICRSTAGVCDVAESCDGISNACPLNTFLNGSSVCRSTSGICDVAETCTGSAAACPPDDVATSQVPCHFEQTSCDTVSFCDGTNKTCPTATPKPASTVCRPSLGPCDPEEKCTGFGPVCPVVDVHLDAGTPCDDATICNGHEACNSQGTCVPGIELGCSDNDTCTMDTCDPVEGCRHTGIDDCHPCTVVTDCLADTNPCTTEQCSGGHCNYPAATAGTPCRGAQSGCDIGEACDGSTVCPTDGFRASGYECRPATGSCDVAETCDGQSPQCPSTDAHVENGTTCTDHNACTVGDQCSNGTCATAPRNCNEELPQIQCFTRSCDPGNGCVQLPISGCVPSECGDGMTTGNEQCDPTDPQFNPLCCTGPDDPLPCHRRDSSQYCRQAVDACDVTEFCDGNLGICPAEDTHAPDGTPCFPAENECFDIGKCVVAGCVIPSQVCDAEPARTINKKGDVKGGQVTCFAQDTEKDCSVELVQVFQDMAARSFAREEAVPAASSILKVRKKRAKLKRVSGGQGFRQQQAVLKLKLTRAGKDALKTTSGDFVVEVRVTFRPTKVGEARRILKYLRLR